MTPSTETTPRRVPGRRFLALGLALVILAVLVYVGQLLMHQLTAPWYLPVAATLGAVCIVGSLWQKRTIWRGLALLLVALVAGAAWAFVLMTRLPPYTGPVAAGQSFPAFATTRADGTPFTRHDLEGDHNSVLVFFRGRW